MPQEILNFFENSPVPVPQSSVLEENIFGNYEPTHEQLAHNHVYYQQMQPTYQYQANYWPQTTNFCNNYDQTPHNGVNTMQPCENLLSGHSISPPSGDEVNQLVTSASAPKTRRKRARTAFTTEQIQILELYFKKRPYVSRDERKILNEKLGVGDKVIKVWFQNRRLKEKRIKIEELAESLDAELTEVFHNKVSQTTNINSYVSNIDELVECIPSTQGSPTVFGGNIVPIYEPISPPESNQEPLDIHSTFAPLDPEISEALLYSSTYI